jgi:hypothetical protein
MQRVKHGGSGVWLLAGLSLVDKPLVWALRLPLGSLWVGTPGECVSRVPLAPAGLARGARRRRGFYVVFMPVWVPLLLLTPDAARLVTCDTCPENPLAIADSDRAGDAIYAVRDALIVVVFGALYVMLARRWRRASPLQRRALAPILFTGLVTALEGVLIGALAGADVDPLAEASRGRRSPGAHCSARLPRRSRA